MVHVLCTTYMSMSKVGMVYKPNTSQIINQYLFCGKGNLCINPIKRKEIPFDRQNIDRYKHWKRKDCLIL